MAEPVKHEKEILAVRRADGESRSLAASLPRLVLEARRIAANVIHGLHGRRRAGSGESFLAISPLRLWRAGAARRLAPIGAR